jgi:hypothetical protein
MFESHRPGWAKPVHAILAETGVTVLFHGHDRFLHFFPLRSSAPSEVNIPILIAGSPSA